MKETTKRYFTCNDNGDLGCHDCDYYTAKNNLTINQKENPAENWEMFEQGVEELEEEKKTSIMMNAKLIESKPNFQRTVQ